MLVLIVDDNGTNRKLCRVILEQSGYGVREAANGEEGLQAVRSEPPGLILMDVPLPGRDGAAPLHWLTGTPAARGVPVVALTSSAMKGDRERFLAQGFSEYVSKPLDIDLFLEVIRRLAPLPPSPSAPSAGTTVAAPGRAGALPGAPPRRERGER